MGSLDRPTRRDQIPRTEFIIHFIWKEPTPSDKLRTEAPEEETGGGGGGTGVPPGM